MAKNHTPGEKQGKSIAELDTEATGYSTRYPGLYASRGVAALKTLADGASANASEVARANFEAALDAVERATK